MNAQNRLSDFSLILMALLCCTSSGTAQGSAADYENARTHSRRHRYKIRGVLEDLKWTSDRHFEYKVRHASGRRDRIVVNAETQEKRLYSAHPALAAINKERGQEGKVLANSQTGEDWEVWLEPGTEVWKVDDAGKVRPQKLADSAFRLAPSKRYQSYNSTTETEIFFFNQDNEDFEIYWIENSGKAVGYGVVKAGEHRRQHTFSGHLWELRRKGGKLARFLAEAEARFVLVDEKGKFRPKRKRTWKPRPRQTEKRKKVDRSWRLKSRDGDLVLSQKGHSREWVLAKADELGAFESQVQWSKDRVTPLSSSSSPASGAKSATSNLRQRSSFSPSFTRANTPNPVTRSTGNTPGLSTSRRRQRNASTTNSFQTLGHCANSSGQKTVQNSPSSTTNADTKSSECSGLTSAAVRSAASLRRRARLSSTTRGSTTSFNSAKPTKSFGCLSAMVGITSTSMT